jgi:hypothetical protein
VGVSTILDVAQSFQRRSPWRSWRVGRQAAHSSPRQENEESPRHRTATPRTLITIKGHVTKLPADGDGVPADPRRVLRSRSKPGDPIDPASFDPDNTAEREQTAICGTS